MTIGRAAVVRREIAGPSMELFSVEFALKSVYFDRSSQKGSFDRRFASKYNFQFVDPVYIDSRIIRMVLGGGALLSAIEILSIPVDLYNYIVVVIPQ